jgi:tetratricopeptide (TPR) repeat protein
LSRAPGEDDERFRARRQRALARFEEAQALLGRGRFPQALAVFEALASDEPSYPGIEERLAATRRELAANTRPSARRLMDDGYRLESEGDMLGAMARYRAAREADANLAGLADRMASLTALMVGRAERLISEADGDRGRGDAASAIRKYDEALRYLPPDHPKAAGVRQQLEKLRAGAV